MRMNEEQLPLNQIKYTLGNELTNSSRDLTAQDVLEMEGSIQDLELYDERGYENSQEIAKMVNLYFFLKTKLEAQPVNEQRTSSLSTLNEELGILLNEYNINWIDSVEKDLIQTFHHINASQFDEHMLKYAAFLKDNEKITVQDLAERLCYEINIDFITKTIEYYPRDIDINKLINIIIPDVKRSDIYQNCEPEDKEVVNVFLAALVAIQSAGLSLNNVFIKFDRDGELSIIDRFTNELVADEKSLAVTSQAEQAQGFFSPAGSRAKRKRESDTEAAGVFASSDAKEPRSKSARPESPAPGHS